jgi:hypothetical protein
VILKAKALWFLVVEYQHLVGTDTASLVEKTGFIVQKAANAAARVTEKQKSLTGRFNIHSS